MIETCRYIYDNKLQLLHQLVPLVIFIYDARSHIHQVWKVHYMMASIPHGKEAHYIMVSITELPW